MPTMKAEVARLCAHCRAAGNCFGTLKAEFAAAAARALPRDAAERYNAHGRSYVALAVPGGDYPAVTLVGRARDRDDVIDAIGASCYIPGWAGPTLTTA